MKYKNLIVLIILTFSHASAQIPIGGEHYIDNCQCKSYKIVFNNPEVKLNFTTDSLKRVVQSEENFLGNIKIDSFYYNTIGQLISKKTFFVENEKHDHSGTEEYTYTSSGKISQIKHLTNEGAVREIEKFEWDIKNRPSLFSQSFYRNDSLSEYVSLSFNFINDTISLLEYRGKSLRSTSKRIHNKTGQIIKESVEKKSKAATVTYNYQYTKQGKLKSVHKVKVIGGDIPSFETYPYIHILDPSRKVEYFYDAKDRLSSYKTYKNIHLDKVISTGYIYTE